VVQFAGLSATGATGSYDITYALAADPTTSVTQTGFEIKAGTATKLAITTQPSNSVSGIAFDSTNTAKRVTVVVQDEWGNLVSDATNAITPDLVDSVSGLSRNESKSAVSATSGSAAFTGLSYGKAGSHKIVFSATGLTSVTSSAFTISPAGVSKLLWIVDPGSALGQTQVVNGKEIPIAPVLELTDASGNRVTAGTWSVTINAVKLDSSGNLTSTVIEPSLVAPSHRSMVLSPTAIW
jgi:hypothetical protein